ncbi:MAG: enoyl-CoA hydratase-related protein [Desulfatiglandales bacterium]|jgi:enoyl-CoA hydratase/carnithine racemase|nr:enoyl-CoA hydratase-related protein [Desulfatiglandales bacterium]
MIVDYAKEGRIATFTINRPEALNAISVQTNKELYEALVDFRDDDELWVGIITGTGEKVFCAGADLKDMVPFMKEHRDHPETFPSTLMRGLELWKPLIAAINGVAVGGGLELALACDIRIASENAKLGLPEVTLGLMPGWGGTQRLPRMIPWCKAAEIVFTGKPVDAQEAYRIGLVNNVVPLPELIPVARKMAEVICQAGPLGVRAAKEAMLRGSGMTLDEGLRLENTLFAKILGSEDTDEGLKAFAEKRKPEYKAK